MRKENKMSAHRDVDMVNLQVKHFALSSFNQGLALGFSEDTLREAYLDLLAQERATKINQNIEHEDSRALHVLQILKNKLNLGFADPSKLPVIPENPDQDKFKYLVLVPEIIRLDGLVEVQNIQSYLNLDLVKDIVETPKGDYWVWMQDGVHYKGKSVDQATKLFSSNERGATCRETLLLHLFYPETIRNCYKDMPGSRGERVLVPCLGWYFGVLGLYALGPSGVDSGFGSVSCGSVS